jgi:hypothetical protein
MTIIISSTQADLSTGDGFGSLLRDFGSETGQPDLFGSSNGTNLRGGSAALNAMQDAVGGLLNRLYGNNQEVFDKSFVGSGRTVIPGGGSPSGGTVSPLEDASIMQTTNQTPVLSVLVKKRAFASLNHLYDPTLMDDAEKWLFRATKRLFARKCAEIADYERLAKIKRLAESSTSSAAAIGSLVSGLAAELNDTSTSGSVDSQTNFFTSMRNLEKAIKDRKPVDTTTWFYDADMPFEPKLGAGSGVFEITLVAQLNTSLSIDGEGSCSFTLENPYNILRISEHDIEMAIRDTALSKLVNVLDKAAGLALANAQAADAQLTKSRREARKSAISFTVSVSGQGVTGTVDAIGMTLTADNLDLIPEPHSLSSSEKSLVKRVLTGLDAYSMATRRNLLDGLSVNGGNDATMRESMRYTRTMMRKFYMGKLIIQPMDAVHVFIDGGTRRSGETSDVGTIGNTDLVGAVGQALGLQETWQIDDSLIKIAWERSGKWLSENDFKKLYAISGAAGTHVFGGLIREASSSYNSENGKYEVSVSVASNIHWLQISRYNAQPSLQQTEGIIYDPLTPFKFETDSATGIPIGRPVLSDTNQKLLGKGIFASNGKKTGELITKMSQLEKDVQVMNGALMPIYDMPQGLKYRWKEGIVTMPYFTSTMDPLDPSKMNERQLRRDIGFFPSNTAMANIDIANIISALVTGQPYNTATFVQSALSAGGFSLDTTLNSGKDYFHSLLDVQKSFNLVQGNFAPFKIINADRSDLAQAIATQQRLTKQSAELRQIKNQYAKVSDDLNNLDISRASESESSRNGDPQYVRSQSLFKIAQDDLRKKLVAAENTFNELVNDKDSSIIWQIVGDDVGFDLTNPNNPDDAKLFGDRLLFVSQRRREDVIYNKDKNFLIVSEEYDKDFDIQAFALNLREQNPEMWKNSWDDMYELCKKAASVMDLEFFCNSQGHLELRPPQYNRIPLTVLNTMLALNANSGIKIFPDFLEKLVSSRMEGLIRDVTEMEYEMMRYTALLGASTIEQGKQKIFAGALTYSGSESAQLLIEQGGLTDAIAKNQAITESERARLHETVSASNGLASHGSGIFSATAQTNLVKNEADNSDIVLYNKGNSNKVFYDKNVTELIKMTGKRNYPSFDEAIVGATRNGKSTPASDVSAITDRIAECVSRRSKFLRMLGKVLEQSIEITNVNSSGKVQRGFGWTNTSTKPSALFEKMVEDDTQSVLGHLSGKRFIIGDENLISYRVTEKPPQYTVVSVSGTEPMLGQQGTGLLGAIPAFKAIGADFDLWRQYGFRQERNFDTPFFWDAESQCAPYAKMLLTRQRSQILNASAEVVGNEFYQLGDVVYLSDLQTLFYVSGLAHNFTYESGFSTTLTLTYGHPPGEYIPTPLDVIGKSLSKRDGAQASFRVRRGISGSDRILAVVRFGEGETGQKGLLNSQDGMRNYQMLSNALNIIKTAIDPSHPDTSLRVVVIAFGDLSSKPDQEKRVSTVANWLSRPVVPGEKSDGASSLANVMAYGNQDIAKLAVSAKMIKEDWLQQLVTRSSELSKTDLDLLKAGVSASDQSWTLDETLKRVVEVRLREPPAGGWPKESNK